MENNLAISVDPNPVFTMTMPKQFNIESIMAQMKNEDPYSKQYEELINFITDAMINKGNHRELILVGTGMGNVPFTHACTFILREIKYKEISKTYIAYLDCQKRDPEWFPHIPKGFPGNQFKMKEALKFYEIVQLYAVRSRQVSDEKVEKINQRMQYVMTGD